MSESFCGSSKIILNGFEFCFSLGIWKFISGCQRIDLAIVY